MDIPATSISYSDCRWALSSIYVWTWYHIFDAKTGRAHHPSNRIAKYDECADMPLTVTDPSSVPDLRAHRNYFDSIDGLLARRIPHISQYILHNHLTLFWQTDDGLLFLLPARPLIDVVYSCVYFSLTGVRLFSKKSSKFQKQLSH